MLRSADRLRVQVTDRGDAGELAEAEAPDLEAKLEGRQKPRGWGLFLIEKMVDEARVMGEGGGRTVELVLRLEGGKMTASELQAVVRERDGVPVIDLAGDVNSGAEAALNDAYARATAGGADAVVLNFARADYINSTGIALIVGLLAQARTSGIEVKAYGLSDHYREIFEITRLADFMTIPTRSDDA